MRPPAYRHVLGSARIAPHAPQEIVRVQHIEAWLFEARILVALLIFNLA
jgi:hypothetical protein